MTTRIEDAEPLRLERPFYGPVRFLMATAGLLCIIVPTWKSGFALREFSGWALFFGVIVAGAWSVGIPLLFRSIFGDSESWTFHPGELHIERSSPWRRARLQIIRGTDVIRTELRPIEWDTRPDSYRIVLHLRSGRQVDTPDCGTFSNATRLEAKMRRRLGLDSAAAA